jgi:hypothetical protein
VIFIAKAQRESRACVVVVAALAAKDTAKTVTTSPKLQVAKSLKVKLGIFYLGGSNSMP